jgi:hypothetical protein
MEEDDDLDATGARVDRTKAADTLGPEERPPYDAEAT